MTTNKLPGRKPCGGNNHPIAVKQFILDRLAQVGEDYISNLSKAYKAALDQLARDRGRKFFYHHASYTSFHRQIWALIKEGKVEFSGHEEVSDSPAFSGLENKPVRKYFRLVRGR